MARVDIASHRAARFQSIDTKLSIALSSVITQAGEVARDVAMQLRHRTQAAGRNAGFVMGREILAMILNHFRTPGVRSTLFTMEHIVKMQYFGDNPLDQFYHKWVEVTTNTMIGYGSNGTVCTRRSEDQI